MKDVTGKRKWIITILIFGCCFILSFSCLSLRGINTEIAEAASVENNAKTIHYSDGSVYDGEAIEGTIRNGTGTYTWSTGESYKGTWRRDEMEGSGEMIWPGLGVYKGSFSNNKRQGKGVFVWTYTGEPKAGSPVSFDGEWENDRIGSKGTLVIAGLGTYSGAFSKQKRSGNGTFTWNNGDVYKGSWSNDKINGEGTLILSDETVLKGKFQNGVLSSGTVTYNVEDGKAMRSVISGKAQAQVKVTYSDGTVLEGKTSGNSFTGNVTITYSSGDKYVGAIKDGLKEGKGTYTWRSGAHYVGNWSKDLMSGAGKYYYGKSEAVTYLSGNFSKGKPSGTLVYTAENKLKYQTVWKDGICTSITYKK